MPATEVSGIAGLCQALSRLDVPAALSVLDSSTGEFLEHRQLRQDPRYKATWDTSYKGARMIVPRDWVGNHPHLQTSCGH
jgi:hypothetical protein